MAVRGRELVGVAGSITFTGPVFGAATEPITVRDGDVISAGGALLDQDADTEPVPTGTAWIEDHRWVAEPDPDCPGLPWLVGSIGSG